jgi:hypothetical protein
MSDANPQPIATYRESSFVLKREFELFADKVTIRGKNRASHFEFHVPLEQLSPDIGSMLTKNPLAGLWGFPLVFLLVALMGTLASLQWQINTPRSISVVSLLTALSIASFFVLVLANRPRIRSYHFVNTQGIKVLDMIESGRDRMHCREFAEHVSQTIKNLRGL